MKTAKRKQAEAKRDEEYRRARAFHEDQRQAADERFTSALNAYRESLSALENKYLSMLDAADRRCERRAKGGA